MSSDNYRWIGTDRRTDAEILREIAEADTSVAILCREEPKAYELNVASRVQNQSRDILMVGVPRDDIDRYWQSVKGWPEELALLVIPPSVFNVIFDFGSVHSRTTSARQVTTIWDWLIQRQIDGIAVHSAIVEADKNYGSTLFDLKYRQLVPVTSSLTEIRRKRINTLGGLKFPAQNPEVTALRAGLFQWHDSLDESHECSQSIEGKGRHRAGDYWHAILHRREPDYGNSKYWFRHVGSHPIFPDLGRRAEPLIAAAAPEWRDRLLKNGWDSFAFVDFCELTATEKNPQWTELAEKIQELEMLLLLASTYEDAKYSVHSERGA